MRVQSAFSIVRFVAAATALIAVSAGPVLAEDLGSLLSADNNSGVSQDILAGQRGGTDDHPNAEVTRNVAITGDNNSVNSVANSMNGAAGLFNVMQNSGNNVAMQSQITVNANIH
jgi:hypothetical protein